MKWTSLATAWLLAGCGSVTSGAPDAEQLAAPSAVLVRWVGAVEDTDVQVAVLVGRGKARLYFCGGKESYATATRWFNVGFDGGEHVEFQEDTWRVHAHLVGGGVTGEVELGDGVTRMFTAELAAAATAAGLYEGTSECGRLGVIVSQATEGAPATAQGACAVDTGGPVQQVDAVAPIAVDAGKIRVRDPGGAAGTLLLQAAALEPL